MSEWRWLSPRAVVALHAEQLAEHGGGTASRDTAVPESALARPLNLASCGTPDAAALAAAYACGIVCDRPFKDGNKRTAFVASATFLVCNGLDLDATEADAAVTFAALARGMMTEEELATWFRDHLVKS